MGSEEFAFVIKLALLATIIIVAAMVCGTVKVVNSQRYDLEVIKYNGCIEQEL